MDVGNFVDIFVGAELGAATVGSSTVGLSVGSDVGRDDGIALGNQVDTTVG